METIKNEKAREQAVRRKLKKEGLILQKSRIRVGNLNDWGGYRVVNQNGFIEADENFDLELKDIEKWFEEE